MAIRSKVCLPVTADYCFVAVAAK